MRSRYLPFRPDPESIPEPEGISVWNSACIWNIKLVNLLRKLWIL